MVTVSTKKKNLLKGVAKDSFGPAFSTALRLRKESKDLETKNQEVSEAKLDPNVNVPQDPNRVKTYDKYDPQISVNVDNGGLMQYSHKDKKVTLTSEERKQFEQFRNDPKLYQGQKQFLNPNVRDLIDYEAVQKALSDEALKNVPKGISSQEQLDMYNQIKDAELSAKGQDIEKKLEAGLSQPRQEVIPRSGSDLQTAGFIASSLSGKGLLSVGGTIGASTAAGAALGSVVPGLGTAIGAGLGALAGTGLSVYGSLLANQGKNRSQDLANASKYGKAAKSSATLLIAEASNPAADKDYLVQRWIEVENQMLDAYVIVETRSLTDTAYRVDEGEDQMAEIKEFFKNKEIYRSRFMNNILYADGSDYDKNMAIAQAEVAKIQGENK